MKDKAGSEKFRGGVDRIHVLIDTLYSPSMDGVTSKDYRSRVIIHCYAQVAHIMLLQTIPIKQEN